MQLDLQTLAVATVFVTMLLGALLLFAGLQNRAIPAPVWWGGGFLTGASGLGLICAREVIPDFLSVDIGNVLVLLGYGLIWSGARVFDGQQIRPFAILVAPAIWLIACRIPAFDADINIRIIVASIMSASLLGLTAIEFWRGRAEPLLSRWPTIIVAVIYACAMLSRAPNVILNPLQGTSLITGGSFTLLSFGTLLFTVVWSFLLLNMTKERAELKHKKASLIDPLTGVANRRAFLLEADERLNRRGGDEAPLAVMLFDLDNFKDINDRFGHAVGDQVLRTFAVTATRVLGRQVLFGRLGGEEFASIGAAVDSKAAFETADRLRQAFTQDAAHFGDSDLKPTVSVGLVIASQTGHALDDLLGAADAALYCAKSRGRDRVEEAALSPLAPETDQGVGTGLGGGAHRQARAS